jgi:radical SAM superfamily enzyme YgiQ (UPF0313 family)
MIYSGNDHEIVGDFPPMGGLYIVSYLKQQEIDVDFTDLALVKNWKKRVHEVIDSKPDVVGLSSTVSNYSNTNYLANYIKLFNKDIKIIVGGPYPSCVPQKYLLNKDIDAVCIGEGEHTLYKYLSEGDNADGLMVRRNGECIRTKPRPGIENLDELPFPDLTQVDLNRYHFIFKQKKPLSTIITSRGCPYHCTYCFHGVHGHRWRARSPKNVMEEIRWQVNALGVRELAFWDDNLTLDQERAAKIFDLMAQEKLDISASTPNGVRVDKVSRDLLLKMKEAGFWVIILAPETGDPVVLERLQKGFTLEQTKKVVKWCKQTGLFVTIYLMMGFPFETLENARNSIDFIKEIKPDIFNINKFYPFPNTPLTNEFNLKTIEGSDYRTKKLDKDLEKLINSAYFDFFSNPYNIWNIIKKVGYYPFFYSVFKMFQKDIKNKLTINDYSRSR